MPGDVLNLIADRVDRFACGKCGAIVEVAGLPMFSKTACARCQAPQTVPGLLGNFLLLNVLGSGGMAAVYRALDQALKRLVAIKVMRKELGDDPKFVADFLREARSAAQLNHPNVVSIFACGQEKGQPYIVMELLTGGRLDEWISKRRIIDEVKLLQIGLGVARGLDAAHYLGLVHGDVKPANILFDKAGAPKVTDFGLAKFESHKRAAGEIWGTPYYIAPEKAKQRREDARSDIYSLGATLFHAFTLKPPFDGPTAAEVVMARLKGPPPDIRALRGGLKADTARLIGRMLEPDPLRRYPTYSSLISDMEDTIARVKAGGTPPASAKRKSKAPLFIVLAALAVLAGLFFAFRPRKPATPAPAIPAPAVAIPAKAPPADTNPPPAQIAAPAADTNAVAAAAGTNTPAVATVPSGPVWQPFNTNDEARLTEAAGLLAEGKNLEAASIIRTVGRNYLTSINAQSWLAIWLALDPWLERRGADRNQTLQKLSEYKFPEAADTNAPPDPGTIPQALAKFMMGHPLALPVATDAAPRPPWVDHFAGLLQGLDHLLAGRMDEAEAALKNYLSHTETEPGWPYSLKPLATRWLERLNTFRGTQKSARDRLAAETPAADIIRELDELRGRVSPMFQPRLAELLGEARKADRAEQSRRAAAENAARLENIQRELDLVDETIAKMQGPLLRKDFAALTSLLDAAGNALTTAEAKTALDGARDAARRLNDFKRGLGAVLAAAPFRHQELGGAATGTESGGLIVTLPNNIGTSVRPWESLSAPLFVQLAAHAANQAAAPADRADRLLAGALFAYYSGGGGLRFAVNLAGQAAQTLPELRETILRLMPDLLPPE